MLAEITVAGLEEREFLRAIEDQLREGNADSAAATLRSLLPDVAGDGLPLPAGFLSVTPDDVVIDGWEMFADRMTVHDRPKRPISAISIDISWPGHLGIEPDERGRLDPIIETSYFSDASFPFSKCDREGILQGYRNGTSAWHGEFEEIDDTIEVRGIETLYGALVSLELLITRTNDATDHQRLAYMIGSAYIAVLVHQAVRDVALLKGLPRPLAVFVGSNEAYPCFEAPVISARTPNTEVADVEIVCRDVAEILSGENDNIQFGQSADEITPGGETMSESVNFEPVEFEPVNFEPVTTSEPDSTPASSVEAATEADEVKATQAAKPARKPRKPRTTAATPKLTTKRTSTVKAKAVDGDAAAPTEVEQDIQAIEIAAPIPTDEIQPEPVEMASVENIDLESPALEMPATDTSEPEPLAEDEPFKIVSWQMQPNSAGKPANDASGPVARIEQVVTPPEDISSAAPIEESTSAEDEAGPDGFASLTSGFDIKRDYDPSFDPFGSMDMQPVDDGIGASGFEQPVPAPEYDLQIPASGMDETIDLDFSESDFGSLTGISGLSDAPMSSFSLMPEPEAAPENETHDADWAASAIGGPNINDGQDDDLHLPPPDIHLTGKQLRARFVTSEAIAEAQAPRPSFLARLFGRK